jgi:hypothetical protein
VPGDHYTIMAGDGAAALAAALGEALATAERAGV